MLTDPNCIFPRSSLSCHTNSQGGLCDNFSGEQGLPSGAQLWPAARRLTGCPFSSASLLAPISPPTPLGGRQASLTKVVLVEIRRPCNPAESKTAGLESVNLSLSPPSRFNATFEQNDPSPEFLWLQVEIPSADGSALTFMMRTSR
jgi:hypothetical protein